jgi:hypothetical protein
LKRPHTFLGSTDYPRENAVPNVVSKLEASRQYEELHDPPACQAQGTDRRISWGKVFFIGAGALGLTLGTAPFGECHFSPRPGAQGVRVRRALGVGEGGHLKCRGFFRVGAPQRDARKSPIERSRGVCHRLWKLMRVPQSPLRDASRSEPASDSPNPRTGVLKGPAQHPRTLDYSFDR